MAKMAKSILAIEDDNGVQTYLKDLLLDNGYNPHLESTGTGGLNAISKLPPDLVILDLGLPDMTGESVCQEIKKNHPGLPVIILTAKDSSSSIVHGLNLGADDYVSKPFVGSELIARIQARLRPVGDDQTPLQVADLTLDPRTLEVKRSGRLIDLTRHEFELLKYLMVNAGRVLSRDMILSRVWAYSPDVESRVVDIYIGYLRKKIDAGAKDKLIVSARGFGYTIKDPKKS